MNRFHRRTAYRRDTISEGTLDWTNQPNPFKSYLNLETSPLPSPRLPKSCFKDLALTSPGDAGSGGDLDLPGLAGLLFLGGGITALSSGHYLRAQASAGALYPNEVYIAANEGSCLQSGVYHFAPQGPGLHHLFMPNPAALLARALGQRIRCLTLVVSAIFWRSLWKYRTRAYRYCLLDAGHLLANLELAARAYDCAFETTLDFADEPLNRTLCLDSREEAALCVLTLGEKVAGVDGQTTDLPDDLQPAPLSSRPGSDPEIAAAHEEGCLAQAREAPAWPQALPLPDALDLPAPVQVGTTLGETITNRRSRRNFIGGPLAQDQLAFLLASSLTPGLPLGATLTLAPQGSRTEAVFDYLPESRRLARRPAPQGAGQALARASLGQMWLARAALSLVLWADLETLALIAGPRAYRHVMIAAGRAGQRLYLAATALGLGCCGVGAFFDQEVKEAVSLPLGASPLYILACGPVKGGISRTASG